MIELLLAAWLASQPTPASTPRTFEDITARLPELDGVSASEQLGLNEAYQSVRWATADLWLRSEMIDPNSAAWGFYSAEPAFGSPPTRAVAFGWEYIEDGSARRPRYVVARRVQYTEADVEAAFAAAFPVDLMTQGFRQYARGGNPYDWPEARANWTPDPNTVARLVRVERSIIDEPSCPALTAALRRLNGLDVPPVRLQGYGPGDGPAMPPEDLVIIGDGTAFRLDVEVTDSEGNPTWVVLSGNHGSIPGDWIEMFEAETADCWRPDAGLSPPE